MPTDRQVHLRLIGQRLVEHRVAIEPMTGMHYLTTPGPDDSYRVEIGYFQPADTWNSVAISDEVKMPPLGRAEIADVDLATIPFHLTFQQLLDLFGPTKGTPLAKVVSQFQKRALSSEQPNALSGEERKILRKLHASVSEIAAVWRGFDEIDGEKLARRARALLGFGSTSPSRRFEGDWASAGS
jgi:hypothetical protein